VKFDMDLEDKLTTQLVGNVSSEATVTNSDGANLWGYIQQM
jgi:hypothetical protein